MGTHSKLLCTNCCDVHSLPVLEIIHVGRIFCKVFLGKLAHVSTLWPKHAWLRLSSQRAHKDLLVIYGVKVRTILFQRSLSEIWNIWISLWKNNGHKSTHFDCSCDSVDNAQEFLPPATLLLGSWDQGGIAVLFNVYSPSCNVTLEDGVAVPTFNHTAASKDNKQTGTWNPKDRYIVSKMSLHLWSKSPLPPRLNKECTQFRSETQKHPKLCPVGSYGSTLWYTGMFTSKSMLLMLITFHHPMETNDYRAHGPGHPCRDRKPRWDPRSPVGSVKITGKRNISHRIQMVLDMPL